MAHVEGARGFGSVVARAVGEIAVSPVVAQVLAEVGVHLVPQVKPFDPEGRPGDVVIALDDGALVGPAAEHWSFSLPLASAPPLVQRAASRTTRDRMARRLAAFCAS